MAPPTPPDSVTDFPTLAIGGRPGLAPRLDRRAALGYLDATTPLGGAQSTDLLTNPLEGRDGCSGHHHRNTDSRAFWLSLRNRSHRPLDRMLDNVDNPASGNSEVPEDKPSDDSNDSEEILTDGSSDALDVLPKGDPIEDKADETKSEQALETQSSRPGTLSDAWIAFLNRNVDKDESHANNTEERGREGGRRGVGLLSFERRARIENWRQGCIHGATMKSTQMKRL